MIKECYTEFGLTEDLMVSGLTFANSNKSLEEANTILIDALNAVEPIRIAAEVIHSDNAALVGQTLNPTKVILFGNPNLGTLIMQKNPYPYVSPTKDKMRDLHTNLSRQVSSEVSNLNPIAAVMPFVARALQRLQNGI